MGYRPVGEGSTGRGGWNIPLPCLLRLWLNGVRGNTPTARPLRGLLPPPSGGGGQCGAIVPDNRAMGSRKGISVRVFTLTAERGSLSWQCIYGISPIGGGADGEGDGASPSPVSCVSG
ncbi:MAG: hypothetical protein PWQ46_1354 [Methanomicrobiaceae archaeon]|nr:hypothetical protein [Methanomicrobiaceae archaeon]